jgi:hypothetical protein
MRSYYDMHELPRPERVVAHIDAALSKRAGAVERLIGSSVAFDEKELMSVRHSLPELQTILDGKAIESDEEKVRIRLTLSAVEELIGRKLGRQSNSVEKVEHLNETSGLGARPFSEMASVGWPDAN